MRIANAVVRHTCGLTAAE